MNKYLIPLMILALVLTGCDRSPSPSQSNIEAELLDLLENDETLQLDGLEDNGPTDLDYEVGLEDPGLAKVLSDTLWPHTDQYVLRFGRQITDRTLNVDFDIQEAEGIAYAHVTRTVQGLFRVLALDSNEVVVDSLVKPFESTFTRHIRFVERPVVDDSVDYGGGQGPHWRVDAMTIGDGLTGTKVALEEIRIYSLGSDAPLLVIPADGIDTTYYNRRDMPVFGAGDWVRVEVDVSNTGPEFPLGSGERVFYHYGWNRFHKSRHALIDGDDSGNYDNTFVGIWRVPGPGMGHNHRTFRGFFDVIDMGTLFAADEAVHNEIWTLPFRSHRRGH